MKLNIFKEQILLTEMARKGEKLKYKGKEYKVVDGRGSIIEPVGGGEQVKLSRKDLDNAVTSYVKDKATKAKGVKLSKPDETKKPVKKTVKKTVVKNTTDFSDEEYKAKRAKVVGSKKTDSQKSDSQKKEYSPEEKEKAIKRFHAFELKLIELKAIVGDNVARKEADKMRAKLLRGEKTQSSKKDNPKPGDIKNAKLRHRARSLQKQILFATSSGLRNFITKINKGKR